MLEQFCLSFGIDMDTPFEKLRKGIPVLISVNPGKFTPNGHIMVLSAYNVNKIRLLDPNDDA